MNGENPVLMSDVGQLKDSHALQYNVVHVDGQRSVYLPVLKQGGNSNTISVVNGVRAMLKHLVDVPSAMHTTVVFDQSRFVKTAIETLLHEGGIGLFLTCLMILIFLGSFRATVAVFFSIPLSVFATFIVLQMTGSSINSMVLGGLALALSRLIDNSVAARCLKDAGLVKDLPWRESSIPNRRNRGESCRCARPRTAHRIQTRMCSSAGRRPNTA
jgi:multidrug efflux pump subunit AcrB